MRYFAVDKKLFSYLDVLRLSQQKIFFLLRYSGIVDSKKFHLKTTKWKFLLLTFPEYQSKKKISNNIESGGGGGGFIT